jgi:hypothetical protein
VLTGAQGNVTVSLASGPNGAMLSGTLTESTQNGVATFSDLSIDTPGAYTLNFSTANDLLTSQTFTIRALPAQLSMAQQATTGTAGQTLGAVTVDVEDANGNVLTTDNSNVTLAIATGPAGATLGGTVTVAAVNGAATFNDLTLGAAGAYTLTASDAALTPATSNAITIAPVPTPPAPPAPPAPGALTVVAGTKLPPSVLDLSSLSIPDHGKATVTVIDAPSGAKKTKALKVAVSGGQITLSTMTFTKAGTYTVQVSGGSAGATQSETIVVTPAVATHLAFSRQPVNVASGSPFNVQVEAIDRFGNVVPTDTSTIALKRTWRNDGPQLGGTVSVAMVNGVANFSDLTLSGKNSFELTALNAAEGLRANSRVFRVR